MIRGLGVFTYLRRKSVVRDLKQVTSFLSFESPICRGKGEVSMRIKIEIKCTVVACTLRSPYTHVDYYNYHCRVTVQMSKPWSQLFCLSSALCGRAVRKRRALEEAGLSPTRKNLIVI